MTTGPAFLVVESSLQGPHDFLMRKRLSFFCNPAFKIVSTDLVERIQKIFLECWSLGLLVIINCSLLLVFTRIVQGEQLMRPLSCVSVCESISVCICVWASVCESV